MSQEVLFHHITMQKEAEVHSEVLDTQFSCEILDLYLLEIPRTWPDPDSDEFIDAIKSNSTVS